MCIVNSAYQVYIHMLTGTHRLLLQDGGRDEMIEHCRLDSPLIFQCLEPFYLTNVPRKMTVPRIILHGWSPLVKATQYNQQFILFYHLLQLNILWVDSSPGRWFNYRMLNIPTQMGQGLKSSEGMIKHSYEWGEHVDLCEGCACLWIALVLH